MRASSLRRSTWLTTSATRAGLGLGSRSSSVKMVRTCGTVTAGVFPPQAEAFQMQEPQGHQRQGHVVVPADPAAHLVVRQADFALAVLEQLLDVVPRPVGLGQLPAAGVAVVAQGVPGLRLLPRLEERRVGEEGRYRGSPYH